MGIDVVCNSCDSEFSVSSKSAGKRVACPNCNEAVRVPADGATSGGSRRQSSGRGSSGRSSRGGQPNSNGLMVGIGIGVGAAAILGIAVMMMSRGGTQDFSAPPVAQQSAAVAPAQAPPAAPVAPVAPAGSSFPAQQPSIGVMPGQAASLAPAQNAPSANTALASTGANPLAGSTKSAQSGDKTADKTMPANTDDDAPLRELNMIELTELIEKSVVRIIVKSDLGASVGSGFVIDAEGSIMTNYHVIEGARTAVVEFKSGKKADVKGFTTLDPERDLAIIKVDVAAEDLNKIRIAKDLPQKGEKVAAFGAPRGLDFSVSDGIVAAIRNTPEFKYRKEGTFLQTTAPISPGNSGGPLVNMRGEVVGVNSFKVEGENLNFAVSSTDIRDVIENRGDKLTSLSPDALPNKYAGVVPQFENLTGTTRGRMLLSTIQDAVILMAPFAFDPSGRVTSYVENQVEKNLIKKAGWNKVVRQRQLKPSTAFVVVVIYFQPTEKIIDGEERILHELKGKVTIIARDVAKDGEAYGAIVWDEEAGLGTISLQALANGVVPEPMKKKVSDFFSKIVSAYRRAQREVESGK